MVKRIKQVIGVSVVIPTYKGAKVITSALDSLANQTLDQARFEVIVVDDCSPDNTIEVVERYKKKIKNLRIYSTHKNTGNPIAGRNIGIEKADGEYIHFLDHDDKLGDETLERLYVSAVEWRSDIIFGKYAFGQNYIGGQEIFSEGDIEKADPFIHRGILEILSPHKMFKRDFVKRHNLFFDPSVVISEDMYFVMKAFILASVISVKSGYDYYYRVKRSDGGNLTQVQMLESPFVVSYASLRIISAIQESNIEQRLKVQWMKLYAERFLRNHVRAIFDIDANMSALDVIDEYMLTPIGQGVVEHLNPEYKLIVDLVRERYSPMRQKLLSELTNTNSLSLKVIKDRVYFTAQSGDFYDASLLYKHLNYSVKSLNIQKGFLVIVMSTKVILNRRENLECQLRIQDVLTGNSIYANAKRLKSGDYEYSIDIRNALWVAGENKAVYTTELLLKCGDVLMRRTITRFDIETYSEKPIRPVDELYSSQLRTNQDDLLTLALERTSRVVVKRIKNTIKSITGRS